MKEKQERLAYSALLGQKNKKKIERKTEFSPLAPAPGSRSKRKRVGRGRPSGHGKTSGRGQKGQQSRSGYSRKAGFEGGQMPMRLRVPKRGFTSKFKIAFQLVNLKDLNRLEGNEATPETMKKRGLIANAALPVKILANGELKRNFKVTADKFSVTAKANIEKAGGSCTLRNLEQERKDKAQAAQA